MRNSAESGASEGATPGYPARSSRARASAPAGPAPTLALETACWVRGENDVAGVDEVGRGAWAGPVVAAAVVLPADPHVATALAGVRDSKTVLPTERERLAALILRHAVAVGIGLAPPERVDQAGLLAATAEAMNGALAALGREPAQVLLDGLPLPLLARPHTAVVRGDACCLSIAAASIVAKVTRDQGMAALDALYPGYLFARHKGYGTPAHRAALRRLGPCPAHRRSYRPVALNERGQEFLGQ